MDISNQVPGIGFGDELAKVWLSKIKQNTEKYYDRWSRKFKCDILERYYTGEQYSEFGYVDESMYEPYVINLIFSTIEVKLPSLFFQTPVFHCHPKPTQIQYDFEMATKRALLREDVLNTIVSDHVEDFSQQLELAILDAFFRFGIVEVGFSQDWIENPHADMPILKSDNKTAYTYYSDDGKDNVIKQPKKLPINERIYLKRIIAKRFRVSGLQIGPKLDQANWVAYWDYVRIEDLKANPNLENIDKIVWAGGRSLEFTDSNLDYYGTDTAGHQTQGGDLIKIWKVWDNRAKKKYIFVENQQLTILEKKFKRLPLFGLRFHPLLEGWLPLPPVRNWKSPQDEYNDSREQSRNHRKRFNRKYLYRAQEFEEDEIDKLLNGGDGTFVKVNNDLNNATMPVPNADLGAQSMEGMTVTKDDFNMVSGTSSEQRLQSSRTTATQAQIVNQNATIRDSKSRIQVATWTGDIGKEMLLLAEENFTAPIWVRMAVPQGVSNTEPNTGIDEIPFIWAQVKMSDLDDGEEEDSVNFSVNVSVDSLSPIENQSQAAYLLFISTLQQFPELATDPLLVRETAFAVGYRNEQVIRRMQKYAEAVLVNRMKMLDQQAQQTNMGPGLNMQNQGNNNQSSQMVNQALPPAASQTQNVMSGNMQ